LVKGAAVDGVSPQLKHDLLNRVADSYVQVGKLAEARAALAGILDVAALSVDRKVGVLNRIGKLYVQEGLLDDARRQYAKVAGLAGAAADQKAKACQWIADTYSPYVSEQRVQARAELAKGAMIEGVSVSVRVDLLQRIGKSLAEEGKLEEARKEYAKALGIAGLGADQKAAACIWCYDTYLFAQRAEARAELGKALAFEGVSVNVKADLLNRLRNAYAETGNIDEAMAEAQKLLDLKDAPKHLKDQAKKYLDDNK
jgi:tetratricopeptide (TPR) repeat protein